MTKRKASLVNEVSDRARECLHAFLEHSPASEALKSNPDNYKEIVYGISSAGNAHSRQTLSEMQITDILALACGTEVSDNGLPEIIVELAAHEGEAVLKVVKTKNISKAISLRDEVDSMPAYITMNGPQSLPGTGIFALSDDSFLPERIIGHDGEVSIRMPAIAVTAENVGLETHEAADIAAAIDGIISIGTNTPVHSASEGHPTLDKARSWALRSENRGDLIIGMPDSLIFERAVRIAKPAVPENVLSQQQSNGMNF